MRCGVNPAPAALGWCWRSAGTGDRQRGASWWQRNRVRWPGEQRSGATWAVPLMGYSQTSQSCWAPVLPPPVLLGWMGGDKCPLWRVNPVSTCLGWMRVSPRVRPQGCIQLCFFIIFITAKMLHPLVSQLLKGAIPENPQARTDPRGGGVGWGAGVSSRCRQRVTSPTPWILQSFILIASPHICHSHTKNLWISLKLFAPPLFIFF